MNTLTTFDDHLDKYHGKHGTESRVKYDADSLAFRLGVMLHEARKEAKLTQEELAKRTGTKKSYISLLKGYAGCSLDNGGRTREINIYEYQVLPGV